jgi:phospholipid/cholesterol/gamma-HCH transport system ATP-binding protein
VRDLSFRRGDRMIFKDVNLDIPRGQVTAIMGPSGTGKTTLLRLIGGQIRPDAGRIEVDGRASMNSGGKRVVPIAQAHGHAVSERRVVHRSECI